MKFECGHEAAAGVGKLCLACHIAGLPQPVKTGRVGRLKMSPEQVAIRRKQAGSSAYVIFMDGPWKSDGSSKYGCFTLAKVYKNKAQADKAINMIGHGIAMELMESEHKTLANYQAQQIKMEESK